MNTKYCRTNLIRTIVIAPTMSKKEKEKKKPFSSIQFSSVEPTMSCSAMYTRSQHDKNLLCCL